MHKKYLLNVIKNDNNASGSKSPTHSGSTEPRGFLFFQRICNEDSSTKGVDIKIGLDIASLAYKKLVDRSVLVSGDADFVPAAKVARREGIDFILDPLWNPIDPELFEHIDGLNTVCPKPKKNK